MSILRETQLILKDIADECRSKKWNLSFAESCTGGLLSSLLVRSAGVSDIFAGSFVSYSYTSKVDLLDVDAHELETYGAVSDKVARQMAEGARRQFASDWALAITGIAGPGGGLPQKPVGTVWFGLAGDEKSIAAQQLFSGDRESIQNQSAFFAANWLLENLRSK